MKNVSLSESERLWLGPDPWNFVCSGFFPTPTSPKEQGEKESHVPSVPSLSLLSVCAVLGTPCSFDLGIATKLFCYLGNCKAKGSQQTEPARLLAAGGCALTGVLSVMPPVPLSAVH